MKTNSFPSLINNLLDFFLPRYCLYCNTKLNAKEQFLCNECGSKLAKCENNYAKEKFNKFFESSNAVNELNALFLFAKNTPIQSLIHCLKYQSNYRIGNYIGQLIASENSTYFENEKIDLIIPVPLHRIKFTERGYNQSFYIAKGISGITKIPLDTYLVKRIKNTESQTHLTNQERKANVKDAFKFYGKENLEGKNILLIDDIITTGSTIIECAKVLKENGAGKIIAFSAALA